MGPDAGADAPQPTRKTGGRVDPPCAGCMAGVRVVRSEDLLQGQRQVLILHGGRLYRLLRTRNDKLILHK